MNFLKFTDSTKKNKILFAITRVVAKLLMKSVIKKKSIPTKATGFQVTDIGVSDHH